MDCLIQANKDCNFSSQCLKKIAGKTRQSLNPTTPRTAKTLWSFGRYECNRVNGGDHISRFDCIFKLGDHYPTIFIMEKTTSVFEKKSSCHIRKYIKLLTELQTIQILVSLLGMCTQTFRDFMIG